MILDLHLYVLPHDIGNHSALVGIISAKSGIPRKRIKGFIIKRQSVDARSKTVKFQLQVSVFIDEPVKEPEPFVPAWQNVASKKSVVIVGAGPAGLFAALRLIELGYKPIVIERGKDVRSRRRDLAAMNKNGIVNPESNYCFGEGGAGTYSDGKLYTRSTKRGDVKRILNLFVHFGAAPHILIEAHPHIGTNKLPHIITTIREHIIDCGGEVHFETRLTDILLTDNSVKGIVTQKGDTIPCSKLILATGHSAQDIFDLLEQKKIDIESKPFALGVRIEHPQAQIDSIQYHCNARDEFLPPASYSLVSQENGRGVFSFCMCPGGIIAPASTSPGELVVNGWSPSKRNNPFANSGTVVSVEEKDFYRYGFRGNLAARHFQAMVEKDCFLAGGGKLVAPAQRMTDFIDKKSSSNLPGCSYIPGLNSVNLHEVLPEIVADTLRKGILSFGKKMRGYITQEAVLVATESRTSSPVRIPRDKQSLEHPRIKGLYPCAEGAGYAGGIVSAAIDGERCAEATVADIML